MSEACEGCKGMLASACGVAFAHHEHGSSKAAPPMTAYQRGGGRRAGAGSSGDSRCCVAELGWGSGWAACPEGDMQSIRVQLGKWRVFPRSASIGFRLSLIHI